MGMAQDREHLPHGLDAGFKNVRGRMGRNRREVFARHAFFDDEPHPVVAAVRNDPGQRRVIQSEEHPGFVLDHRGKSGIVRAVPMEFFHHHGSALGVVGVDDFTQGPHRKETVDDVAPERGLVALAVHSSIA